MDSIAQDLNPELHTRIWSIGKTATRVVLCLHGVESHAEWFEECAEQLSSKDTDVLAYDRPGWGQSPGERGHLQSYQDEVDRIARLVSKLRTRYASVHLLGLSWGGLLALYVCLRRGFLFDSLTLMAPGVVPKQDLDLWGKIRVGESWLLGDGKAKIPLAINPLHFTPRPDRLEYLQQDPLRTRYVTAQFCIETLKMRSFCKQMARKRRLPPTLLLLAGDDEIVDNNAVQTLLAKDEVVVEEIPGEAHSLVFEAPVLCAERIEQHIAHALPEPTGKRVVIVGAGAVGGAVGALMSLGGHDVTLIGRERHVRAFEESGWHLRCGEATRVFADGLQVVDSPEAVPASPDLLIFAVKGFHTREALASVRSIVDPSTVLMSLQNGVSNEVLIGRAYPEHTILGGAICAYLNVSAPNVIDWANDQGGLAAGLLRGDAERAHEVCNLILRDTRMEVAFSYHSEQVKWSKLMLNVAFNALNAVTGLDTGSILAHPVYGRLAVQALKEAFAVVHARRLRLMALPGYNVPLLGRLCYLPTPLVRAALARITAKDRNTVSSMQQDLARGRSMTEIEEINGAIVRYATEVALPAPANRKLADMVRSMALDGEES